MIRSSTWIGAWIGVALYMVDSAIPVAEAISVGSRVDAARREASISGEYSLEAGSLLPGCSRVEFVPPYFWHERIGQPLNGMTPGLYGIWLAGSLDGDGNSALILYGGSGAVLNVVPVPRHFSPPPGAQLLDPEAHVMDEGRVLVWR